MRVAQEHPLVLEAADEIVPSNDDDGVARTVERLLPAQREELLGAQLSFRGNTELDL